MLGLRKVTGSCQTADVSPQGNDKESLTLILLWADSTLSTFLLWASLVFILNH